MTILKIVFGVILCSLFFFWLPGTFDVVTAEDSRLDRNLYVVFDASGSMYQVRCSGQDRKITVARNALITFLEKVPQDYILGLYTFDSKGSREVATLERGNRARVKKQVKAIQAGGKTPLNNAINEARLALQARKQEQMGYGEYTLLIVTDGEANNKNTLPASVDKVVQEGFVVEVIGFCLDQAHSLKTQVHRYREANSQAELQAAFDAVLGESEEFTNLGAFEFVPD